LADYSRRQGSSSAFPKPGAMRERAPSKQLRACARVFADFGCAHLFPPGAVSQHCQQARRDLNPKWHLAERAQQE
jgi:hypothetical protein